jgi:hypothetical protein
VTSSVLSVTGEVLTGWHIYPLQLDDLSPISYSSNSRRSSHNGDPAFTGSRAEATGLPGSRAEAADRPNRAAPGAAAPPETAAKRLAIPLSSDLPLRARSDVRAPTAADVGPIFYRCALLDRLFSTL